MALCHITRGFYPTLSAVSLVRMDDITPSSSHGPSPHGRIDNFAVLGKRYRKKLLASLTQPDLDLLDAWHETSDPVALLAAIERKRDNTVDGRLTDIANCARDLMPELRHLTRARVLGAVIGILQSDEMQFKGKTIVMQSTEAWPTSGRERRPRRRSG